MEFDHLPTVCTVRLYFIVYVCMYVESSPPRPPTLPPPHKKKALEILKKSFKNHVGVQNMYISFFPCYLHMSLPVIQQLAGCTICNFLTFGVRALSRITHEI
jgi:hypothetical protein